MTCAAPCGCSEVSDPLTAILDTGAGPEIRRYALLPPLHIRTLRGEAVRNCAIANGAVNPHSFMAYGPG